MIFFARQKLILNLKFPIRLESLDGEAFRNLFESLFPCIIVILGMILRLNGTLLKAF